MNKIKWVTRLLFAALVVASVYVSIYHPLVKEIHILITLVSIGIIIFLIERFLVEV
ncbi:hypothetical protein SAMN04488691_11190 [Haloferax larsenii]|uniref:Uncharacterized protein n=1 Tax=Haloferax larsenii TaxID=302484 RepID=A0A1H7U633_HALLR|nr:hypothetical protein SAMN04488691_11190 [Haloferax larsenii]